MTKKIILFITIIMIVVTMGMIAVIDASPSVDPITHNIVLKAAPTTTFTVKPTADKPKPDKIPPIITVLGNNQITINVGSTYKDAGATALDNVDGDITDNIIIDNPVDDHVVGTYTVTYDVSDSAGNHAQQKKRTVNVIDHTIDDTPPEITAPTDITVQETGTLTHVTLGEPEVTDDIDPNPTITNDAPSGDNFPPGTTIVTWTATDNSGNSNTAEQSVTVESVLVKLAITSFSPNLIVEDTAPSKIKYNITMNQNASVLWEFDGWETLGGKSVTEDTYKSNILSIGTHVLTVTAQNGTDSDTKTWNINIKGNLDVSAVPEFVNIGQPTTVTIKVSRKCGIDKTDICTGSIPVAGAIVSLTGIVTANGMTNDTGEFVTTINGPTNGIVNVTASNPGYVDSHTNIYIGIPIPNKLTIIGFSPNLIVEDTAPSKIKYNITMNQNASVIWKFDGWQTPGGQSVTEDTYKSNILSIGTHVLTVTAQNGTDSDTKTWNINIKGNLDVSAVPEFVNVGQPTTVTIKVSRKCGIDKVDDANCTGRVPVSGAIVSLTGIVNNSSIVNDTTGEFVTTINTTTNGIINVTASKSGYFDGYTNITVGVAPTPPPSSGGSSGGGSSGGSSSGGGGGGGGLASAEPYSNILKYEVQDMPVSPIPVSFKYKNPELSIYEVKVASTQSDIASLRNRSS